MPEEALEATTTLGGLKYAVKSPYHHEPALLACFASMSKRGKWIEILWQSAYNYQSASAF
jgi:hypothetical protein